MDFIQKPSDLPSFFVRMIIRPPRANYEEDHLGPSKFTVNDRVCERIDLELENDRGLKLQCSHFIYSHPYPGPCVIYLHGNCGCRLDAFRAVSVLLKDGISVFCFDFSGSGLSDGKYISLGYYEKDDVKTVVEYLRTLEYVTTIGLWGRSMGAATAIMYAASDPSIAGMVLDSPFTSLPKLATEIVQSEEAPVRVPKVAISIGIKAVRKQVKSKLKFDIKHLTPITFVESCFSPVLFVHGESDTFILPHHGKELYDAYCGDKNMILVEGNHNSIRPNFCNDSVSIFFQNTLLAGEAIQIPKEEAILSIPSFEELELYKDLPNIETPYDLEFVSDDEILQKALLNSNLDEDSSQIDSSDFIYISDDDSISQHSKNSSRANSTDNSITNSKDNSPIATTRKKKGFHIKRRVQSLTLKIKTPPSKEKKKEKEEKRKIVKEEKEKQEKDKTLLKVEKINSL